MAERITPEKAPTAERQRVALQLFAHRSRGVASDTIARQCFRDADAFLKVAAEVESGTLEVKPETGPQLSDVSAPNLDKKHPINLASKAMGNLARVQKIGQWLKTNPTPERDPEELAGRINAEFDLAWGLPEIDTARAIFPAYAAKELAAAN
jgi:hypothetical protein